MTADRDSLRFYVDESALGLGKTLAAARKDTIHVGHRLIPECPLGIEDHLCIPAVAARDLVVLARDGRIRSKPQELEQLRTAGLGVLWIVRPGQTLSASSPTASSPNARAQLARPRSG